jgi:hypothetical protein
MRFASSGFAVVVALLVAGCGGGGSSSTPMTSGGSTFGTQSSSETAITTANAMGEPMTTLANDNSATSSLQSSARRAQSLPLGTCQAPAAGGSLAFFAPDKNGDPNSTEQQYFYDAACAQLARDVVRRVTPSSVSAETVTSTTLLYAQGNATPIATRTESIEISNATFDSYFFPVPADGFDRSASGNLSLGTARTVASADELVMTPVSAGSEAFCGDAAGYNATGIAALGETFGWQGSTLAGTRTVNADGSVTWNATHAGSTSKGAIGALSIAAGTPNTACPIATPMFALAGGTSLGAYTIPAVATYQSGLLIGLTITNASLANGTTLNVTTNAGVSPTSSAFISGTIASSGSTIATFAVDTFGDGSLTMSSGGTQFVILDWHVVK